MNKRPFSWIPPRYLFSPLSPADLMEKLAFQGEEIDRTIRAYTEQLTSSSRHARALVSHQPTDMPKGLSFRQGDLICLQEKLAPSGWCKGICGEKEGFFPANAVMLLPVPNQKGRK